MGWLDSIEARNNRQKKYDKNHTKGLYLKLNLKTDQDIIRWTWHQKSIQGAIKELIRADIRSQRETGVNSEGVGEHEAEVQ